ncbi:MAG: hypothetical protein LRY41_02315 [Candidatus Pacebacteria bacterium]|nr:hypothetical protein [Candidatus Paceibacterota bacterium]MCD8508427.1 hypothetical protein [Candidatus Paceibacterota bacterium]MCD8528141.1 hypothetical protein [Candidatus Paceibacterota bacterium]MCD8563500.1 hypothetical protein [Candidatus Paceibacterota bacterium]
MQKNTQTPEKQTFTYFETLFDLGFHADEAKIYEWLLKNNQAKASAIAVGTGISRVLTYRGLDKLVEKGIIEKIDEDGSPAYFEAKHPSHLSSVLEKQKRTLAKAEIELQRDLGKMASDFNLATGKPNVQFFEGLEGVEKMLHDSLTTTQEIYTYADFDAVQQYFGDLNARYVHKRRQLQIHKKALITHTSTSQEYFKNYFKDITDIRFIPHNKQPFAAVAEIYDNKVSYITISENGLIGVLIEDVHIANMHRVVFEALWHQSESISEER